MISKLNCRNGKGNVAEDGGWRSILPVGPVELSQCLRRHDGNGDGDG